MLQIKNLNIVHKKDLRTIVENFQFSLNPGDKAVLIGEEGNGKSTLLKWIYDPESIADYAETEGECICTGEKLGYLPQELPACEREKSVYEFFCTEELFWEQEPLELGVLARSLHLPVDFFYREQRMSTLSGGEKVKAQIARILMAKPTILLLDEPSNDIDIETLEWLERFILESRQAFLYISHDETLIENTANVIIHLEQIRRKTVCHYTVARMSYGEYLSGRSAQMQNQLRNARNDRRQEEIRQEKLNRIMQKVEYAQENVSRQAPSVGRLLLKMSISGANVLILDEPTRNFSPLSNPVIREVLRDFSGAIISVSHDRKYIREVCTAVYELSMAGLTLIEMNE